MFALRPVLSFLLLACLAGNTLPAAAAESLIPKGGRDMLLQSGPAGGRAILPADKSVATASLLPSADAPWAHYWRIDVLQQPANAWSVQVGADVTGGIRKGDRCLLSFFARSGSPAEIVGAAHVEVKTPPSYPKLGSTEFKAGPKWEQVFLPFIAGEEGADGRCSVAIHLGSAPQAVEIGGLRLLNYGPSFPFASLPRPLATYKGREPDAPWRKAALARIEKDRKGTFDIAVVDADGKPVPGAEIHAVLKRHEFGFGTAVTAKWMNDASPDGEKYRAIVDQCFSRVVLENDLKLEPWDDAHKPDPKGSFRKVWLDHALKWFSEHDITVRGHYLCWAPFEPWSEKLRDRPEAIRERVLKHIKEMVPAVGDQVCEWDALNHPVAWQTGICINTVLGDAFYAEVFKEARKLTSLPLWINEDQVFRPGRQQEEYYTSIQNLIAAGVTPDGIGNQAHFHASFLPSPEELLANSDRFAALVPALQITEFDVNTNGDEELAADFTRDILITTFSHPAYTGFVMWGFWEGSHWKPDTALWRKDWSEKPAAKVWKSLVNDEWKTDVTLKTDDTGHVSLRGFYGLYELVVTKDGKSAKVPLKLNKEHADTLQVVLP